MLDTKMSAVERQRGRATRSGQKTISTLTRQRELTMSGLPHRTRQSTTNDVCWVSWCVRGGRIPYGHNDHVTFAPQRDEDVYAPVLLHPGDDPLWQLTHPGSKYWSLHDGQRIAVAGTELHVIHAPGHSPGSVCLHLPEADALFSGDTLFAGGPGATGRSFSDFPTIIASPADAARPHERLH